MLGRIKAILKNRNYTLFTRPYELNVVGLRSKNTIANKFDDEMHVFYKTDQNKWNYHLYKVTTDPGTYWLNNPKSAKGTAILKEGQYLNSYKIGKHQNKIWALVQVKPVSIMRDYDRNSILDFNNGKLESGLFGINIHPARNRGKTLYIDKYSAGCQVFQSKDDFSQFLALCKKHETLYGNSFSYTLVDFRAVRRITIKRVVIAASFLTTLIVGFILNGTTDADS